MVGSRKVAYSDGQLSNGPSTRGSSTSLRSLRGAKWSHPPNLDMPHLKKDILNARKRMI